MTKYLRNMHMSTIQKTRCSPPIVKEGHRKPQEWYGESTEPWSSLENAHRHSRQQDINKKFFCDTRFDVSFVEEKE